MLCAAATAFGLALTSLFFLQTTKLDQVPGSSPKEEPGIFRAEIFYRPDEFLSSNQQCQSTST